MPEEPLWSFAARVVNYSKDRYARIAPGVTQRDRLLDQCVRRHLIAIDDAVTRHDLEDLQVLGSQLHQALDAIYATSVAGLDHCTEQF
jgi:hypothetical protein